jgi:hypothetical protein
MAKKPATKPKPAPLSPLGQAAQDSIRRLGSSRRDLPVASFPSWDNVPAVKSALLQMEQGKFLLAAMMAEAMLADDRIAGVWSARSDGVLSLPLEMRPPEGMEEDAKALDIAEAAREDFPKMLPEATLGQILYWGRLLGVGLGEKVREVDEESGRYIPRLKVWHPRFVYWQWGMMSAEVPPPEVQSALGNEPSMGLSAGYRGFRVITGDGVEDVPKRGPDWLLYLPYGYQRGWTWGLLKALAIVWMVRQWAIRDWARYSEIYGQPVKGLKVPQQWDEDEKKRALQEIAGLASDSTVMLPQDEKGYGFALELIEAQGHGAEVFEKLIAKCDTAIAVRIIGQNLTTEISGASGSRAAAQVHDRIRGDILKSDAETLATSIRDQLLMDWVEMNFGHEARDLCPWPHWGVEPPDDKKGNAEALSTFATGVATLRSTQLPVDFAELAERFDLPLLEGKPIPDFVPPAPPAPPAGEKKPEPAKEPPAKKELTELTRLPTRQVQGQIYADYITDQGLDSFAKLLAPDVQDLVKHIKAAEDWHDLRAKLKAAYKGMDATKLAKRMEQALIIARLAGRWSALDAETEQARAAAVHAEQMGAGLKAGLEPLARSVTELAAAAAKPAPAQPAPVVNVTVPPQPAPVVNVTVPPPPPPPPRPTSLDVSIGRDEHGRAASLTMKPKE